MADRKPKSSKEKQTHSTLHRINFDEHQEVLDSLFHTSSDSIPVGSSDYYEFQEFLLKLVKFKSATESESGDDCHDSAKDKELAEHLDLPDRYNARYRVNLAVVTAHERRARAMREKCELSSEDLGEYRHMLTLYENFLQKRSMAKLTKLRRDQGNLPIASFQDSILEAIKENSVVVIAGDTGCGKSTQVPQFLLKAGYRHIACTQPRRISAIALCRRVAFETLREHGSEVAYRIRFESTHTSQTRIVFLTEGVLLRELLRDPLLTDYSVIIIDEVHERHITTDLLLGLLKQVVESRPDLRVVLMSATINVKQYSSFFGGAPTLEVPGRLYPIRIEYIPPPEEEGMLINEKQKEVLTQKRGREGQRRQERLNPAPYLRLLERIDQQFSAEERGDMLVFLSGMQEISTVADALRPYASHTKRWIVLVLHSTLSVEEQDQVFDLPPPGVRKVILSTNIAETSVTIDGVRFVVDSGRAKEMVHDVEKGMGSLQERWISKASAEQRAGRAGRTGPGFAFRLYSIPVFQQMKDFAVPEIQCSSLEAVVLQIKALGAHPKTFSFLDPPPETSMTKAITNLCEHEALIIDTFGRGEKLTSLGKVLASLPVDVHIGKIMVLGSLFHVSGPIVTMAAAMSVQSPFVRLPDTEEGEAIKMNRKQFHSPHGDPFSLMELFNEWIKMKGGRRFGSRDSSRRWCKKQGVEEQRLIEMAKLQRQFQDLLEDSGLKAIGRTTEEEKVMSFGEGQENRGREGGGGTEGKGQSMRRHHKTAKERREASNHLRILQRAREKQRGRKVLSLQGEEGEREEKGVSDESAEEGSRESRHTKKRQKGRGGGGECEETDLRNLELELAVDVRKMASEAQNHLSRGDFNLLKFIICSGLYPQVAVGDRHNAVRREYEHLYHTRLTKDARIHPGSVLASVENPIREDEVLAYSSLLETTSLYLSSMVRAPFVPVFLLTGQSIDSSEDSQKLLMDDWLLVKFDEPGEVVEHLLMIAFELRAQVASLLRNRLRAANLALEEVEEEREREWVESRKEDLPEFAKHILDHNLKPRAVSEKEIAGGLSSLMDTTLRFTCEILSPEASASLFSHTTISTEDPSERSVMKGGVQLTRHFRYGSLKTVTESSMEGSHLRKHWTCAICETSLIATASEIELHLTTCGKLPTLQEKGESQIQPESQFQKRNARIGPFEQKMSEKDEKKDMFFGSRAIQTQGEEGNLFLQTMESTKCEDGVDSERKEDEVAIETREEPIQMDMGEIPRGHRVSYSCLECEDRIYLFTPPQILQHQRMHKRTGGKDESDHK